MGNKQLEAMTTRVGEIQSRLSGERNNLLTLKSDLSAAKEKETTTQVAYDQAVRDCYQGKASRAEEDRARAEWTATTVEIDRLQRIIPMVQETVTALEQELHSATWVQAQEIQRDAEARLETLTESVCDKYEELAALGQEMRNIVSATQPAYKLLGQPDQEHHLHARVAAARQKRDARRPSPLIIY